MHIIFIIVGGRLRGERLSYFGMCLFALYSLIIIFSKKFWCYYPWQPASKIHWKHAQNCTKLGIKCPKIWLGGRWRKEGRGVDVSLEGKSAMVVGRIDAPAWAYPGTTQFLAYPILSQQRVISYGFQILYDRNKRTWKFLWKVAVGVVSNPDIFQGTLYSASRGCLCDSTPFWFYIRDGSIYRNYCNISVIPNLIVNLVNKTIYLTCWN